MIAIIGAGPAGMSAAYHLRGEYLIFEKENDVGGLCRSFDLGGATFDMGGHAFFTKHDYVRALVDRLCPEGLYQQPRRASVWSHGRFVRYPFQMHLYGLPTEVIGDCLVGLLDAARTEERTARPDNLQDWIDRSFGPGIGTHFLTPYNEKLWAFPLSEVSPDWCSERIVAPDVSAIVAGALQPQEFSDFPNATVLYPARGGFQQLYGGFLPAIRESMRWAAVTQVHLGEKRLLTSAGGEFEYDWLISTMPLNELVRKALDAPDDCRIAASRLRHNSLYLVNLVFDQGHTDWQRVYAADSRIPFHKLVVSSNSSPDLRARNHFAVQAEVTFSEHKRVDRSRLIDDVHDVLADIELVGSDSKLVASSVLAVDYAYPVYTAETRRARKYLLDTLERHHVLCAGRFGEWMYINSDEAVMSGRRRAERVNATRGW